MGTKTATKKETGRNTKAQGWKQDRQNDGQREEGTGEQQKCQNANSIIHDRERVNRTLAFAAEEK